MREIVRDIGGDTGLIEGWLGIEGDSGLDCEKDNGLIEVDRGWGGPKV